MTLKIKTLIVGAGVLALTACGEGPVGKFWTQEAGAFLDEGGFGNPHERAAELVAEEVRAGVISVQSARDDYGVVVDENTFAVDDAATAALRQGRREQLPQRTTP